MVYSLGFVFGSSFVGFDLPLYIKVGQVHGGLGSLVYGLCAAKSRRVLPYSDVLTARLYRLGQASTRYAFWRLPWW
jgi:hypothetical protein